MGKQWNSVRLYFLGGSKITADGDCSHEIKRCLLLGRKVMTNLDSIFKSRDITLLMKVRLVKAMVFPVVMYGCQSWTVKKTECRIIDAKAETPELCPPHPKGWLIGKDFDAGRDWGQEEQGTTKDEMAGWHHWLNGCESEWTPWVGDGQGGLACCDSWGRQESDTTEQLNWTESDISWFPLKWKTNLYVYTMKRLHEVCLQMEKIRFKLRLYIRTNT